MKRPQWGGWVIAVLVGYVLLALGALSFIPQPWNYAVLGFFLVKGLLFWSIIRRVATFGSNRRRSS